MHTQRMASAEHGSFWNSRALRLFGLSLLVAMLSGSVSGADNKQPRALTNEFQFVRMIYPDYNQGGGWRRRGGKWTTDAPESEEHFLGGIRRLSNVDAATEGVALDIMDDAVFDYPFLYAVEVGYWYLDDAHAQRLREYLLRGGTLMVDDFHGTREWAIFAESMQRVFPDRPMVDLADADGVFHVVYDVDHRVQIPGTAALSRGVTYEYDGYTPYWRGVIDDDGRLMVIINFNMDLGDAWEHADDQFYPQPYTLLAYQTGINYLMYAMTH